MVLLHIGIWINLIIQETEIYDLDGCYDRTAYFSEDDKFLHYQQVTTQSLILNSALITFIEKSPSWDEVVVIKILEIKLNLNHKYVISYPIDDKKIHYMHGKFFFFLFNFFCKNFIS